MERFITKKKYKSIPRWIEVDVVILSRIFNDGLRIKGIVYNHTARERFDMSEIEFAKTFKKI